ncbi:MAG: AMP-binding protein, partial [Wenzhouxiangellaceae bacterium]
MIPWLADVLSSRPKALALSAGNRALCYSELAEAAARRASTLQAAGVRPSSRVALALGADPLENALWIHALLGHGAAFVPLSPNVPSARRDRLLRRLDVHALVSFLPDTEPELTNCAVIDARKLPERGPDPAWPGRDRRDPASTAFIVLTSGSDAEPKLVPLTLAQLDAGIRATIRRLHLNADDQWLCCMPLDHIAGLAILLRALRSLDKAEEAMKP